MLCFSQALFSDPVELRVSENSYFEIVGSDIASIHYVNELSGFVGEALLKEFAEENYLFSRKVLVQLLNDETLLGDTGFYDLTVSNLGLVTLSVSWNDALSLPNMIEALVVSFLQSYGYASYGELFLEKYPSKAWILKGLSHHIYASLRPNVRRLLYEQAILEGFEGDDLNKEIKDLTSPSSAQSFVFYRFIKSSYFKREARLGIINRALIGSDVLPFVSRFLLSDPEESLGEVLSAFLSSQLVNTLSQYESLASSKKWIESLGDFSSIEIQSIKAKRNSLHLLWANRGDPTVAGFIEARIQLISLALNRINPLYYNAAQSLALTYQKIIDGVEEWELLYYFSDFLAELDQANAVCLQISEQLKLP